MIERLIGVLEGAGLQLDDREWADAIWLAAALRASQDRDEVANRSRDEMPADGASPTPGSGHVGAEADAARKAGVGQAAETEQWPAGPAPVVPDPKGRPARLARERALPRTLQIARALRPIARRRRSPMLLELDVDATVHWYGETGWLVPVLRHGRERWFELDLVVDAAPTMTLWSDVVGDLTVLLTQRAGFRTVSHWTLDQSGAVPLLRDRVGTLHGLRHLRPGGGRRLVLMVSDGLGAHWYGDDLWTSLAAWCRAGPVALLQVLPTELWGRTGIGYPDMTVVPGNAAEPTARLRRSPPWWWDSEEPPPAGLPVLSLNSGPIAAWAGMVTGTGERGVAAVGVTGRDPLPAPSDPSPDPQLVVQAFKSSSSTEAYQLAVHLSAVPLLLPLIRDVQSTLLPGSTATHLAEVLASRLVEPVAAPDGAEVPLAEFRPGVREALQALLTTTEVLDLLRRTSAHVRTSYGTDPGYTALLSGLSLEQADPRVRPFLEIGGALLQQLVRVGAIDMPAGSSASNRSLTAAPVAPSPAAQVTSPTAVDDPAGRRASTDLVVRVESRPEETKWSVSSPHLSRSVEIQVQSSFSLQRSLTNMRRELLAPHSPDAQTRLLDRLAPEMAAATPPEVWEAIAEVAGMLTHPPEVVVFADDPLILFEASAVQWTRDPLAPALLGCQTRVARRLSNRTDLWARSSATAADSALVVAPAYESLPSLLGAAAEASGIAAAMPGSHLLLGKEATRAAVIERLRSGQHRVVHLAGHSSRDGFHLADGLLAPADVLLSAPPVPLVFLNMDDNRDMVNAFLRAGAGAVIAPCLPVDDQMAARFSATIYSRLLSGTALAEAARQARTDLITGPSREAAGLFYQVFGDPRLTLLLPRDEQADGRRTRPSARTARPTPDTELRPGEPALAAIEEAVAAYRRLAEQNPDVYLPELASSLVTLSSRLDEWGRREPALAAIEEAVVTYRRLADHDLDIYLPELASSAVALSILLAEVGRPQRALGLAEEAVGIRRRLAEQNPDVYLPDLASSLVAQSILLAEVGRRPQRALGVTEEAVGIRRRLAEQNPDVYLPDLASSLVALSSRLADVGRLEQALGVTEEAVTIRRRLAEQNPDAYLPGLASLLLTLASRLDDVGRPEDALSATEEAVGIRRRLAEQNPDAYLPHLASALNDLSIRLATAGRYEEGLRVAEEAVGIRRRLAEQNPDTYLPGLADSLDILSIRLAAVGRPQQALSATEEAVGIRRRLAGARRGT